MPEQQPEKKTIRLGDLRLAQIPLDVEYAGQTVTIEFRPYVMDAAWEDALDAVVESVENSHDIPNAFRTALSEVLAGWNVVDDAGQPVPLDLRKMPGKVVGTWYKAIMEYVSPNSESASS